MIDLTSFVTLSFPLFLCTEEQKKCSFLLLLLLLSPIRTVGGGSLTCKNRCLAIARKGEGEEEGEKQKKSLRYRRNVCLFSLWVGGVSLATFFDGSPPLFSFLFFSCVGKGPFS